MIIENQQDALNVLLDQQILAFYQGNQAEIGPRALGNRSFLFDPRNKHGKDIVNKVKKRENYRPFAGTILLEHVNDWFDIGHIKESPHMLFSVPVKENKKNIIPSIVHVDGTCRIQTVSQKQNKKFYELIKSFYKKTNVPILLNTSFNMAGEPLVNNVSQALRTIKKCKITYLYIPGVNYDTK